MQIMYSYSFSAALRQTWEGKQATNGKPNGPLSKLKTQRQRLYGPAMQIPIGLPELSPITATSRQVSTSKTNRVTEVTITNKLFPNAVIDVSGRCGWTVTRLLPHGITETEEKQLHRLLSKRVKKWKTNRRTPLLELFNRWKNGIDDLLLCSIHNSYWYYIILIGREITRPFISVINVVLGI